MIDFRLPAHIGMTLIEGVPILLDLRQDRYFALDELPPGRGNTLDALTRLVDAESLFDAGMLVTAPKGRPLVPQANVSPVESLGDEPMPAAPSPILAGRILASLLRVRCSLAAGRLEALAMDRSDMVGPGPSEPMPAAVARFIASRRLVPLKHNCLADSLVLRRFLGRRGHRTQLVFGVKLHPFGAHCWLQHDELLINESCDTAAQFAPVLIT